MIFEQTIEKLSAMKLSGMVAALEEWQENGGNTDLEPSDLIGLLADAEWGAGQGRKLTNRLRQARLPMAATVEEIDYKHLEPSRISYQRL
jgi:hypothetical protein